MRLNNKSEPNKYKAFVKKRKALSEEEIVFEAGKLIKELDEIDVDSAYAGIQERISSKGRLLHIYTSFSRYAAILILPLIFITVWTLSNKDKNIASQEFAIQELTCPVGMRTNVTLPDGSKVWLNSESTIKYSIPFTGKSREVELVGHAFLDVTKNPDAPFSITSGNVRVDVLGTQFDFKSYPEDETVEVTLKEGSINLSIETGNADKSKTRMVPGDHFVLNKTSHKASIKNESVENYIGWVDNKLIFDETPLPEMKRILERWYGVEIEIVDKSIESYKFTTTFNNESLSQVLELLELSSPIKMEYIPGKVDKATNQITKAKIEISKK